MGRGKTHNGGKRRKEEGAEAKIWEERDGERLLEWGWGRQNSGEEAENNERISPQVSLPRLC